jgi:hypothetical protein
MKPSWSSSNLSCSVTAGGSTHNFAAAISIFPVQAIAATAWSWPVVTFRTLAAKIFPNEA